MISTSLPASRSSAADFAGALSASDHRHALPRPRVQCGVLASVAHQRPRQALELSRPKLLLRKPGCDHDALSVHGFAVLENQTEPVADILDADHLAGVEIGDGLALEPLAVTHELLERLLLLDRLEPMLVGKGIERKSPLRIGNVGGSPGRLQLHPLRHAVAPERHRHAEHPGRDLGGFEMRGDGKAVGSGADDGHIAVIVEDRKIHGTAPGIAARIATGEFCKAEGETRRRNLLL